MFQPVVRQKLYQDVVSQLLGHIQGGRFAPGSDLPAERELAELLGVGRLAVREGLHSLQERGVIAIRHGRRAQVLEPSSALLAPRIAAAAEHVLASFGGSRADVLEARIVFESAVARLAAERATAADIARLKAALAANRAAVPQDLEYLDTDLALHRAIATTSGNGLFVAISEGMLGWLRRYRVDLVRVAGANRLSHREHARIVERIAARDPEGAARAMTEHLKRSNALYSKLAATARTKRAPGDGSGAARARHEQSITPRRRKNDPPHPAYPRRDARRGARLDRRPRAGTARAADGHPVRERQQPPPGDAQVRRRRQHRD